MDKMEARRKYNRKWIAALRASKREKRNTLHDSDSSDNDAPTNSRLNNDLLHNEPLNVNPQHDEPVNYSPLYDDQLQDEPRHDNTQHDNPLHHEHLHDNPQHDDPLDDLPLYYDQLQDEPRHDNPQHDEPVNDLPLYDDQLQDEPRHDNAQHDNPLHHDHLHDNPWHDEQLHDEPWHDGPQHDDQRQEGPWDIIDNHITLASDSESEEDSNDSLESGLVAWANEFRVKHNALDGILKLLKECGHPDLPVTARTLLNTPQFVHTQTMSGMEYHYLGLKTQLIKHIKRYPAESIGKVDVIEISFNIDGLPLFKSTKRSLWPVLCAIVNVKPIQVFPVALAYGDSKPQDLEFLSDTINEINEVLANGIQDGGDTTYISLRCVVCDAPAKALVKRTKLFSGYYGCDKCNQRGKWFGRVTYPDVTNIQPRTDEFFRAQSCEEHHHGVSPFCEIPIDMIKCFPIDYMHQVCIGVVKRLILCWLRGKREFRQSAQQIEQISQRLVELKRYIPDCFARKPRSLSEVDRWKATEYRQFLLYTGKIVLKGILREDLYHHFMSLSVALSILVSPRIAQSRRQYAHELLERFVNQGRTLYGNEFLVYNVHSMIHLAAEADKFGSLDMCSAFPFENYMQQLKKMVRSGRNPIAQIVKRLAEQQHVRHKWANKSSKNGHVKKNKCAFITNTGSCCEVVDTANGQDENGNELLLCRLYERARPSFTEPCDSRIIGVYKVNGRQSHMSVLPVGLLDKKAIKVDHVDGREALPSKGRT